MGRNQMKTQYAVALAVVAGFGLGAVAVQGTPCSGQAAGLLCRRDRRYEPGGLRQRIRSEGTGNHQGCRRPLPCYWRNCGIGTKSDCARWRGARSALSCRSGTAWKKSRLGRITAEYKRKPGRIGDKYRQVPAASPSRDCLNSLSAPVTRDHFGLSGPVDGATTRPDTGEPVGMSWRGLTRAGSRQHGPAKPGGVANGRRLMR